MEERKGEQESIVSGDLPTGGEIHRIGGEIIVRENSTFGCAGGSGSVDDAGGSVAIEVNGGAFVGERGGCACEVGGMPKGNRAREFGAGNDGDRVGIREDVGDLAISIEDIYRDEDDAELDAGEVEIDHLDRVGEIDAEAVARMEAALGKQLCEAIATDVDVAEGVGDALIFESGDVAAADEREVEELGEVQSAIVATGQPGQAIIESLFSELLDNQVRNHCKVPHVGSCYRVAE